MLILEAFGAYFLLPIMARTLRYLYNKYPVKLSHNILEKIGTILCFADGQWKDFFDCEISNVNDGFTKSCAQ